MRKYLNENKQDTADMYGVVQYPRLCCTHFVFLCHTHDAIRDPIEDNDRWNIRLSCSAVLQNHVSRVGGVVSGEPTKPNFAATISREQGWQKRDDHNSEKKNIKTYRSRPKLVGGSVSNSPVPCGMLVVQWELVLLDGGEGAFVCFISTSMPTFYCLFD